MGKRWKGQGWYAWLGQGKESGRPSYNIVKKIAPNTFWHEVYEYDKKLGWVLVDVHIDDIVDGKKVKSWPPDRKKK